MRCPSCGDETTRVIDTRVSREGDEIRRRRTCEECGRRFTTRERYELQLPKVIKGDQRREEFDRSKLLAGITLACVKRPVSVDSTERLVNRLEVWLQETGQREVTSREIGDRVMQELRELDRIAAIRFASVYESFDSAADYATFMASFDVPPKGEV
ncbi:MAG: transcriptional regulator NrdR [Myxococcota bacterium]|nr:transcriptional regulator NrdR [Spirochaeta sp.]RPG12174.1 MAG: transcriptional repressor NrdR [Proteobacteria bacterium TMED72]